jgi:hypothetical protein
MIAKDLIPVVGAKAFAIMGGPRGCGANGISVSGGSSTTALESGFRGCAGNRGRFLSELTLAGGLKLK